VPAEGELAGPLDGLTTLLGFLGFHGSGSAWQTRLVDGSYAGNSVRPAVGQQPAALHQAASWVPNDAIFAQVTTMDPVGLWTYVQDVAEGEEQLIDMLLERGLDVEADLFGNLGRELTLWVQPVRSLAPPQLYGVVPVRDGEALMRVMDGLCDFIAELQGDLGVSHRPYRGSTYTVLDLGIPIGFSPSYTVLDGNLWFSNSSTLIKRTIRQIQKGEDYERGAHPFFAELLGDDGRLADDIQSAFYFDAGSLLAAYYSTGRAFAGMIPPDMGLPPDLASSLPEPEIFERHFRPETSVTRLVGGQLHTHRVSSLGPEVPLLGLVAGAGLGFVQASAPAPAPGPGGFEFGPVDSAPLGYGGGGPTPPAPAPAEPSGEAMLTSINLQLVDLALLIYSIENSDYPTSLDELVEATPAYPEGYLQSAEVPLDGWGRALHYARTGAGVYELYSFGPNGQDDGGAGDDLGTDD
jgi:hypothetical protein